MIGRKTERAELNRLYASHKAEFVAIYGRRRVGKTYLVDETFKNRITFRHAGLSPVDIDKKGALKAQLSHFYYSLQLQGMKKAKKPSSWLEAFFLLEQLLEEKDDGNRQLVFLDELPWLDTPRSGFITALEGFWNTWACHRDNLMLVVCGSANSWILDKLVNNHGGLYNRLTYEIKLYPFTLHECEDFFRENSIRLSRYDVAQAYMIFGGIPYYFGYFQPGKSLAQNVDLVFFSPQAKLRNEFDRLFSSVFAQPEIAQKIVRVLYTRRRGLTRKELVQQCGMGDGGTLSDHINALIASDMIIRYTPFGEPHGNYYKLVDPFCLFYLHFADNRENLDSSFWMNHLSSQNVISWRGLAFENVCFNHLNQIRKALGISGVITKASTWVRQDAAGGTQVDLLLSREDNVINMCEVKYYSEDFTVSKEYYRVLLHRQELLAQEVSRKVSIHNTLITTFGLKYNEYSGIFSNTLTLDDLFAE